MTEIIVKDELRSRIEAESGGKQTVLFTAKGQPTYMNVIPAFKCEELGPEFGTGLHPAFIAAGKEVSEIFIATYQAVIRDGEALSLPGQDPAVNVNIDQARATCTASGAGFHLMTNWEWSAIALWCIKNGFGQLRGNTDFGKSHAGPEETGKIAQYGRTLTGSGPDTWRHNGTSHGIADLVGNVWEWVDGLKLASGRIIMPIDNDFTLAETNWPDTGSRIDIVGGCVRLSDEITERGYDSERFAKVGMKEGYAPPAALKQALLCHVSGQDVSGRFWGDNTDGFEALPIRGGCWGNGDDAGLAALYLDFGRSNVNSNVGFRPAFIG
jgi:hypothetical protein